MYSGFWHMHKHKLATFPLHTLMIIIAFRYLLIPVNTVASKEHSQRKVVRTQIHM